MAMFFPARRECVTGLLVGLLVAAGATAGEQLQWGQKHTRNMVSAEKNLPDGFDPASGKNVKWTAKMGSETYLSPIVTAGKVLIGTNNSYPRDPRHKGDRGILLCLSAKDGAMLWQLVVPKLRGDPYDPYLDWPRGGVTSPPVVEGDRAWVVTNRGAMVCLDLKGQSDGNDGPCRDDAALMAPKGQAPLELTEKDADILWRFDTHKEVGSYPHDAAHAAPLLDGDLIYYNTSNGVDNTHRKIRRPDAPSLIVLNKNTGKLVAQDAERIGPMIFHCSWSSPALGTVGGKRLIFYGGGDGVVYAFEALDPATKAGAEPIKLRRVWKFDCDPTAPKKDIHTYVRNRKVSPSNIMGMPVFYKNRVYVTAGGDMWWGKRQSWLKCIDAGKTGDVTRSAEIWSAELTSHSCTTPSIQDGLVYIGDNGGFVRCLDAETGKTYWSHKLRGPVWASTMVADGKVYIGSRRGDLCIFAAGKEKRLLTTIQLDGPISALPTPSNGVLYLTTMKTLYAIEKGK